MDNITVLLFKNISEETSNSLLVVTDILLLPDVFYNLTGKSVTCQDGTFIRYESCTIPQTAVVGLTNEVVNVIVWDATQQIVKRMSAMVRRLCSLQLITILLHRNVVHTSCHIQ